MPIFTGNKTWNAHGQERKEERKKGRKKRQKGRARKRMEKEGEKNEGQRTTRAKESETSSNVHKIGNTDRFSHP